MRVMSKNIVYAGQSFLDKVIECTGSLENAFEMAFLNGLIITDDLIVGTELKSNLPSNKVIFDFFTENNRPASNITTQQQKQATLEPYGFPYGFPISF